MWHPKMSRHFMLKSSNSVDVKVSKIIWSVECRATDWTCGRYSWKSFDLIPVPQCQNEPGSRGIFTHPCYHYVFATCQPQDRFEWYVSDINLLLRVRAVTLTGVGSDGGRFWNSTVAAATWWAVVEELQSCSWSPVKAGPAESRPKGVQ